MFAYKCSMWNALYRHWFTLIKYATTLLACCTTVHVLSIYCLVMDEWSFGPNQYINFLLTCYTHAHGIRIMSNSNLPTACSGLVSCHLVPYTWQIPYSDPVKFRKICNNIRLTSFIFNRRDKNIGAKKQISRMSSQEDDGQSLVWRVRSHLSKPIETSLCLSTVSQARQPASSELWCCCDPDTNFQFQKYWW